MTRVYIFRAPIRLACVLIFLVAGIASHSSAGTLDLSVVGMFPSDVSVLGYADLSEARKLPWFPQFESQLVPVALYQFEQTLATAEMTQSSPIDQVTWASVNPPDSNSKSSASGQLIAVANGDFDVSAIQSFLDSRKIAALKFAGYKLYDSGSASGASDVYFTLVDSDTLVFGPLVPLKRVLHTHDGEEDSLLQNEAMMTLIESANGRGVFWGALDSKQVGGIIQKLLPGAANFPQFAALAKTMNGLLVTVQSSSTTDVDLQTGCASKTDAFVLAQLLQAGLLVQRYETSSANNPELVKLLGGMSVSPNGSLLDISFQLTDDQVSSLIEHNTFISSM